MQHYHSIQILQNSNLPDIAGKKIKSACAQLHISTGNVLCSKLYSIDYEVSNQELHDFAHHCLHDTITEKFLLSQIETASKYQSFIAVAKLPGVTDDEGISAQMAFADFFNVEVDTNTQHIFSQGIFYFEEALNDEQLEQIAKKILGNPLIHHFQYGLKSENWSFQAYVPKVQLTTNETVETVSLNLSEEALIQLSKEKILALNLAEMQAIQAHYKEAKTVKTRQEKGLSQDPTDCELEILAQTWSEHCKHKEFNAIIHYENKETGEKKTITSLFKTYIKGATDVVAKSLLSKKNDWLIKVFTDNAGVVKVNDKHLFVWKVETHNSPSALDPYGGAITGILGNNRDPLGTGIGGTRLLFNTNVLCFGPPDYSEPLIKGQIHPRQIMEGVRLGIEDGGNKSGVPTVNGAVVFDDRYSGKPLVYCGTGGLLKYDYLGKPTWEKNIDKEDRILMAGGRVGKDGIHGATFSSIEIDENSPQSAVQIGSPITQKKMADFMIKACEQGLIKCSTDNGAGGLSSSVGELATLVGGAVVHLEKVPLKYAGLKPWEIFISESQERMTLVVEKEYLSAVFELAKGMEVEVTDIGYFTETPFLDIRFNDTQVAYLDMHFLHEGNPQKIMHAIWEKPNLSEPTLGTLDYNEILLQLMASLNICSRENIIRQYDHEVKGKTIIKPLMGDNGKAPQDAAVVRVDFESYDAIVVSNGILPRYGDIDAYDMSVGAFDEAMRQIISVGGSLPNTEINDGVFWSVNDNFCVPDSFYDAQNNPDGKLKLAKLVQMCEGLYDMATYFDIPLTSGKDSMKNDFKGGDKKISIPPTILYSMTAKVNDFRKTITSDFKESGDLIYQVGETYDELGASEFYQLFGEIGTNVPKVRKAKAKELYLKVMEANKASLIESSHDLSDGGLAVALTESAFGGNLGANIDLDNLGNLASHILLFSESHSRFIISIQPKNKEKFESIFVERVTFLGTVTEEKTITIQHKKEIIIQQPIEALLSAWENGLVERGAIT